MHFTLLVFILLIGYSKVYANCCDYGFLDSLCLHCYGNCVIKDHPGQALKQLMHERLFGQDHAIDPMVEMIDSWHLRVTQPYLPGAPIQKKYLTSFHIAGENGVGKTFVTTLMADAIYQYKDNEGFLLISGTNYEGNDRATVEKYKESLFNIIAQQLEKCPRSLIIIDEVQYMHSSTLRVLQQFMDKQTDYVLKADGKKVFKNEAIIGLISDFGREGRTQDMAFEDLVQLVNDHVRDLWDDPRQSQLIQYTFPFVALTEDDIESMMRYIITNVLPKERYFSNYIKTIQISEPAIRWLRYKAIKKYPNENGRGADKYIETEFSTLLRSAVKNKLFNRRHTYFNVDIRYRSEKVEINLQEAK